MRGKLKLKKKNIFFNSVSLVLNLSFIFSYTSMKYNSQKSKSNELNKIYINLV